MEDSDPPPVLPIREGAVTFAKSFFMNANMIESRSLNFRSLNYLYDEDAKPKVYLASSNHKGNCTLSEGQGKSLMPLPQQKQRCGRYGSS